MQTTRLDSHAKKEKTNLVDCRGPLDECSWLDWKVGGNEVIVALCRHTPWADEWSDLRLSTFLQFHSTLLKLGLLDTRLTPLFLLFR